MIGSPAHSSSIRIGTRLCQLALTGLIVLQLLWHGWANPVPAEAAADLSLALLPLLPIAAAWAFKGKGPWVYGGIAALIYFCHGVMEAVVTPATRGWSGTEVALCLVYFAGLHLRTRGFRAAKRES